MDAVILAGGAGRRLGGPGKPALPVAGRPMLLRVLAAVAAAQTRVVVGPPELAALLPAGVIRTQEEPPGGGPVEALAVGLRLLVAGGPLAADDGRSPDGWQSPDRPVAVLAADLPLLTPDAVDHLARHVRDPAFDGAVYVDDSGRPQWLCGVWRLGAIRQRLAGLASTGPLAGRALRELFGPLRTASVHAPVPTRPPWYDCDTAEELAFADRLRTLDEGET